MAFEHAKFSGNHFEIGVSLGKLGGEAIRNIVPTIDRVRVVRARWLGSDWAKQIEDAGRRAYPQYFSELEGIAEGADVAFEDIFLWNCRGDFPDEEDISKDGALGCTTIMENSGASHGGRNGGLAAPISIAHNEDGYAALNGHCSLVTLAPENDTAVTSFHYPGLIPGHNFGCNAHGLVQTVNHLRPKDQKPGIPRHLISRASLASRSLDEAVEIFRRTDRASGFHYAIAQCGDQRLLSIEAPASACVVHDVKGRKAHANHLLFDEFTGLEQITPPSTVLRQEKADALLSEGAGSHVGALVILSNDDNTDYPICQKRSDRDDVDFTLATAEFEVFEDRCQWSVYEEPSDPPALVGMIRP